MSIWPAGELDARVRPSGPGEVRAIGGALNHLATRIGELLAAERESVADLSHRLRTPLTAMRLDAEALRDPEGADRLSRDVDALARTVDEVIFEARRPVREGIEARCDAAYVVRDRLEFWSLLAEEEDRDVTAQISQRPLPVRLSAQDLSSALDALLGNVFAHTPAGTPFSIQVEPGDDAAAVLTVADHGPGFTTHETSRRGSSTGNSTGLGLDIARRTAEATGGHLVITASGSGAVITLVLR